MDNKCKVIISNHNIYREVGLPEDAKVYRVGTTVECDFRLPKEMFFSNIRLDFINNGGNWSVTCSDEVYISEGDARRLVTSELRHGSAVSIQYQDSNSEAFALEFTVDFDNKQRSFERAIDISKVARLSIGAGNDNDIAIKSPFIRKDQIVLTRNGKDWNLTANNISYGIYRNGNRQLQGLVIKNGDFFSVSDVMFYIRDGVLWMDIADCANVKNLPVCDYVNKAQYPMFVRNTRMKYKLDEEPIKILDPGNEPSEPREQLLMSMMPALAMIVLIIVVRGFMSSTGGSFIIFSVCSMALGIVTTVAGYVQSKKKYKADCEKRKQVYIRYIEKKCEEIKEARSKELENLQATFYSTEEDLQHLMDYSSCLFDRLPEDKDFIEVYLGKGKRKAVKKIDYKEQEKLETGDELNSLPTRVSEEFAYINEAPITIGLKNANAVGVIGNKKNLYEMMKCFVVDLVSRQYQGDVKIYAFLDEEVGPYHWLRMLPHIQQEDSTRNIVCDNASKNNVFEGLYKELTFRSEHSNTEGYNVVLVMNEQGIKSHPISKFIECASKLHTVFVFFENEEERLPLHCSKIVKLDGEGTGTFFYSDNKAEQSPFTYTLVDDTMLAMAAQKIAPAYCEEISLEGTMRKNITLYELLGIYSVEDIDLKQRWMTSKIYETMAAPLGVNAKDDIVYLDLHEKFHGPHGLVAGTTGSGKSEILQSFILSAATLFHPYEIGFVIIDFKGGGMVNQFRDLPHLNGAITNIDGNEIQRSLKSIKAELLKRQNCFAEAGVNHIDKYIHMFKEGKVSVALPHLVIIVDEFAELKAEQPEFMKELVSAARIGRSLGVHLILATQKPSGVVDAQIWSNSKFKLCLKVQSREDSNEVLKTPLAAEIKEPGRAYLQVGNNEIFELFQSAYSGAPAVADVNEIEKEFVINQLDFAGMRKTIYEKKKKKQATRNQNQLEAIVDYISRFCKNNQIMKLPSICLPSLPHNMTYENYSDVPKERYVALLGRYDDPDRQRQDNFFMDFTAMNHMVIGSAQTGKTNVLQTIIRSFAENYAPSEINMYILDFGSMILRNFNSLRHVGGVVCSYEDEKFSTFFRMMEEEKVLRKAKLLEAGVSSFAAYKEAGYTDIPQIVILIDNLTAMKELYLQDNDPLLNLCREGVAIGISIVVANAQTSGIGYRYLSNFEGRIALFCNDSGEYSTMIEGCRTKLSNIPGRMLAKIGKNYFEAQAYMAFEGEKEYERVNEIKKFIDESNEKWKDSKKAKRIPEIPASLDLEYIETNFDLEDKDKNVAIGIDFETIMPIQMNLYSNKFLAISGKKETEKDRFTSYLLRNMEGYEGGVQYYVVDDASKKWIDMQEGEHTAFYTNSIEDAAKMLVDLEEKIEERYDDYVDEATSLEEKPWIVLLVEGQEILEKIGEDEDASYALRRICERYAEMKVFVLFNSILNASIPFNASELMKMIKREKNFVIFDEIGNIKVLDVPSSIIRKYAKQLEKNDAYFIEEGALAKVKVVL